MKNLLPLFLISVLLVFVGCDKSGDNNPPGDLSELIVGKWEFENSTCNGGNTFRDDGTWSHGAFDGCVDLCGLFPYGGTYSVSGDILTSVGGPAVDDNLNGRLEISNDVFTLYDVNTDTLIIRLVKTGGC